MTRCVDLHVHSIYSDGTLSPVELVKMAAERSLAAIAIADHDSVDGIDEALEAGARLGVEVVPAVELSVEFRSYEDIHLLGYWINHRDSDFREKLVKFRRRRDDRGQAIIERINAKLARERKRRISYEEVVAMADGALGRPHIARVLIEHGHVPNVAEAFKRYLEPCNVPKLYFPMAEALAEVRRIGGVSVLAHPTSISEDRTVLRGLVHEFTELGLDGLEAFNNMCYADDMLYLEELARENRLTLTGGSDFHGFEDDVEMGIGRGGLAVQYRWVEALKKLRPSQTAA
jgi:hypothetical protein